MTKESIRCVECDRVHVSEAAANACARADKNIHDSYRDGIHGDDV